MNVLGFPRAKLIFCLICFYGLFFESKYFVFSLVKYKRLKSILSCFNSLVSFFGLCIFCSTIWHIPVLDMAILSLELTVFSDFFAFTAGFSIMRLNGLLTFSTWFEPGILAKSIEFELVIELSKSTEFESEICFI